MKTLIKKALTLALASLLALGLTACGGQDTSSKSTLDKDTWIVGLDDSFAPMGFKDENGEIVGFDVDLAKALGEKLEKEITFQPINWDMKESELKSGNIDFIWNGYTITDERKEQVSFSKPYLNNKQVIVTLADSAIKTKADLKGKKVGAQSESSAVSAMEKETDLYQSFDGGKAITFEDNNQALMDLEAGRLDAVVADEILLRYYITLKGAEKYAVLDENFGDEEYGVGMRKDDQKMVDAFNKAYDEMKADGTLKEISEKWFNEDITN
ncbi:MAG: fliY1 [Clostridia bacterium]|jgi:polar amino acid transport system substrate-binding protein|nr:fliY1 [Clostridia bacterium]